MNEWMKDVTVDMLPEAHRKFAEVIGVEATLKLCAYFGGGPVYVPTIDTAHAVARNQLIRREFARGARVTRLADRYGLTERMVQQIVEDIRPEQISVFDTG